MDVRELTPADAPPTLRACAVAFLLYALLAFGLHQVRGATHSDFGSFDDEPSHLVTGLMFRDYIAAGLPGSPRAFAENYYVHYPKVGIGQWPPVFYALQGVWMLAFGESAASLLALMSALTALLATGVFAVLFRRWGTPSAFLLALLLCAMPLVQRLGSVIMTEIPLALFALFAALQFGRFLETERARHALAFAGLSTLAILTKGNALALGLLPAFAVLLSGRWSVLRRPALWASGALVALVCAPWYWFTLSIATSTWGAGSSPSLDYATRAATTYATGLVGLGGVAVTVACLVGIVVRPSERAERCRWAALVGLLAALLLFHTTIPSSIELRHLVLVAAPWTVLAGYGLRSIAYRTPFRSLGLAHLAPALLLAAFFVERFELPPKDNHGYRDAVARIAADPTLAGSRVLIASDAMGEGLFIAAGALADQRTDRTGRRTVQRTGQRTGQCAGRVILRATKVLGSSTWSGHDYRPAFADMEAMADYLEALPVGVVAFDLSTRRHQWFPHMDMLRELLETRSADWQKLGEFDVFRDGTHFPRALRLYRQVDHERWAVRELDFETLYNRTL